MMDIVMCVEEFFQKSVIFGTCTLERHTQFRNLYVREMVNHVMAETHFTVYLLFAGHMSVLHLLEKHDLGFVGCDQHEHLCCKITTTERVLTEERQGLEVRHVRVEKNEGYLTCVQLVGKVARNFYFIWDDYDAVGI